jgi:hypothetical protein
MDENILITNKHILIYFGLSNNIFEQKYLDEINYVVKNFCGIVLTKLNQIDSINLSANTNIDTDADIYICGDIQFYYDEVFNFIKKGNKIHIIQEITLNYIDFTNQNTNIKLIGIGQVPINIYDIGVYFRKWFDDTKENYHNIFQSIVNEHQFQTLTESNKPTNAFRTGIYISKIEQINTDSINDNTNTDELKFHLLRCSSNLSGPTDNTRPTDLLVMTDANMLAEKFFTLKTSLNHVLAQIYSNSVITENNNEKEIKAKIKAHSDKTKDMPSNGLMAFCSFYQNYNGLDFTDLAEKKFKKSPTDLFDYVYGDKTSVLTKLRFRLKTDVENLNNIVLTKQFDIVLYPNSIFLISLKTNRLYTHEIVPSGLPIDKIPIRMGYVIRCSKTQAIYKNNKTFLIMPNKSVESVESVKSVESDKSVETDKLVELTEPDTDEITRLKNLYFRENMTSEKIIYNGFNFSLNKGDYKKPIL